MSSSAIATPQFQAKIGSIQNQADTSAVYNGGIWSFKNSTALTSVTITDAGNVGIGTTPSAFGSYYPAIQAEAPSSFVLSSKANNVEVGVNYVADNTFTYRYVTSGQGAVLFTASAPQFNGAFTWATAPSGTAGNAITWQERMRIDASGNLLVGTTASVYASDKVTVENTSNSAAVALGLKAQSRVLGFVIRNSSGTYQEFFCQGTNTTTGSITTNGTTTAYNPSSDERLKENIEPLTNALAAVKKLQPRKYTWKSSGVADDGFIAQELQQIPEFAHRVNPIGERDGEVYYGVDYMRFVSYLTAAIQELSAKNETLEARLAALEAKP